MESSIDWQTIIRQRVPSQTKTFRSKRDMVSDATPVFSPRLHNMLILLDEWRFSVPLSCWSWFAGAISGMVLCIGNFTEGEICPQKMYATFINSMRFAESQHYR
jgi:hypothetical protein